MEKQAQDGGLSSRELSALLGERELIIALHGRNTIEPRDQEHLTLALAKKELEAQGVGWLRLLLSPRPALLALGNHIVMMRMAHGRIERLAEEVETLTAANAALQQTQGATSRNA